MPHQQQQEHGDEHDGVLAYVDQPSDRDSDGKHLTVYPRCIRKTSLPYIRRLPGCSLYQGHETPDHYREKEQDNRFLKDQDGEKDERLVERCDKAGKQSDGPVREVPPDVIDEETSEHAEQDVQGTDIDGVGGEQSVNRGHDIGGQRSEIVYKIWFPLANLDGPIVVSSLVPDKEVAIEAKG